MKISNGIDLVEVSRIHAGFERHGEHYFTIFLTPQELDDCRKKDGYRFDSIAARFAAKEAFSKALGTGIAQGVKLQEIEVIRVGNGGDGVGNGSSGAVAYRLHGSTADIFVTNGWQQSSLSLSHDGGVAIASCVIWGE